MIFIRSNSDAFGSQWALAYLLNGRLQYTDIRFLAALLLLALALNLI